VILETLKGWLGADMKSDSTLQLIAAQIFVEEKDYKQAFKVLQKPEENLKKLAMCVSILWKMDRVDLAVKYVKQMQDIDDDDALTQLATAWLYIAQGGEKVTEASFVLQELLDKFGPSIRVLNLLAVSQLQLRNYSQASQHLKQARDQATKLGISVSAETLVNTIVCSQHLKKSNDVIQKLIAELKSLYPNDGWLAKQNRFSSMFDQQAERYK